MKTKVISCRECKKDFTVYINKDFNLMTSVRGLANCNHHKEVLDAKQAS